MKKRILEIVSAAKSIWLSEIYRNLIREGYDVSWPQFLQTIGELEEAKRIKIMKRGNMKFVQKV